MRNFGRLVVESTLYPPPFQGVVPTQHSSTLGLVTTNGPPLRQKLNEQRILKQCCCQFRKISSKTTLKAWYVKRLPTAVNHLDSLLKYTNLTLQDPQLFIHLTPSILRLKYTLLGLFFSRLIICSLHCCNISSSNPHFETTSTFPFRCF